MDAQLFEMLLYRGESETLDFKVWQYSFDGATDDERSELLKDILAFSNAWRDADAYILIGVEESPGKAKALGIPNHLKDHELQTFVNSRTQRPIRFGYTPFTFDNKQFGVIHIPVQERPFHLRKKFEAVEADKVYIRRGSSTGIASLDEIAKMGAAISKVSACPDFQMVARPRLHTDPGNGRANFHVAVKLLNCGAASAYDVVVDVGRGWNTVVRASKTVWDLKPSTEGNALHLRDQLHPGSEQNVALFNIGKAYVEADVYEELRRKVKLTAAEIGAVYEKPEASIHLKVFCRDQPPALFDLTFSKGEIESREMKTFSPSLGLRLAKAVL